MDKETQNITSLHEAELRRLRERIDRTYTQLYDTLRVGGSGGGAPTDAPYIVVALDARLDNERALAEGWGIDLTDGGAGGNMTIATDKTDLNTEYLRLDRIIRMGATWNTYEKSAVGLTAALAAAAAASDLVWAPAELYDGIFTVPDGVILVGMDRKTIVTGLVMGTGSGIAGLSVLCSTADQCVLCDPAAFGASYIDECDIINAGAGDAVVVTGSGTVYGHDATLETAGKAALRINADDSGGADLIGTLGPDATGAPWTAGQRHIATDGGDLSYWPHVEDNYVSIRPASQSNDYSYGLLYIKYRVDCDDMFQLGLTEVGAQVYHNFAGSGIEASGEGWLKSNGEWGQWSDTLGSENMVPPWSWTYREAIPFKIRRTALNPVAFVFAALDAMTGLVLTTGLAEVTAIWYPTANGSYPSKLVDCILKAGHDSVIITGKSVVEVEGCEYPHASVRGNVIQLDGDRISWDDALVPLGELTDDPTGVDPVCAITSTYGWNFARAVRLESGYPITYWLRGTRHQWTPTWDSPAHADTNGSWYLYVSALTGLVEWSQTPWSFKDVHIAYVWYGASNNRFALQEHHGFMPWSTHQDLHANVGTYRVSGGAPTAGTYTVQPESPDNAANTPGFDAAVIIDEDLEAALTAWTQGTYTNLRFSGSGTPVFNNAATIPFQVTGTYPNINIYSGGSFTDTETSTGKFFNVYQVLVPTTTDSASKKFRMLMLQPQVAFDTLANAQVEDFHSLYLGTLPTTVPEFVPYTRITFRTDSAWSGATGRCRIEAVTYLTGSRVKVSHVRYTDAEAEAVADTQIATHTAIAAAHHARYTDSEAQTVADIQIATHAAIAAAHHAVVTLAASAQELLTLSTQAISLPTKIVGMILAGPLSGAAAAPTFKALSHVAVADGFGKQLFNAADGLLLLGPGCPITSTAWTSLRGQVATLSGAFQQVAGRWAGTRGLRVEGAGVNLFTNPSFEVDFVGWGGSGITYDSRVSTEKIFGVYAALISTFAETIYYYQTITVTAVPHTLSCYMKPVSGTMFGITAWFDSGGVAWTSIKAIGNGWFYCIKTGTPTAGARQFGVRANSDVGNFYVDGFDLVASAVATSHVDGDQGVGYAWTGTPHNSTSTRAATQVNLDAHAALLSGRATWSLSLWWQPQYSANADWPDSAVLFDAYGAGVGNRVRIEFEDADDCCYVHFGADWSIKSSAQTFAAGDWQHVGLTCDFTTDVYTLYINGVSADVGYMPRTALTPTEMNLGSDYAGANIANAAYNELALFGRVLTAVEIAAIYASGAPLADAGALAAPVVDGRGLRLPVSYADVSDPPTDAELTAAFGWQPDGFTALLDDAGAATKTWKVWRASACWWYEEGTKAT